MRRPSILLALSVRVALAGGATAVLTGCDAPYQHFLDSVPVADLDPDRPARVYLAIDGMSRRAFDRAREGGAFAGYHAADLVTVFPGTSDYAWTRTLRAGTMGGYEIQHFDPVQNRIESGGVQGVAEHPLREGIAGTYDCYRRFDFLGNGDTWQLESYLDPEAALRETLDALFDTVAARARTKSEILAYLINLDVVGHMGGEDLAVAMLVELDRRIRAFKNDHRRPFQFTLFADHGNAHRRSQLIDPRNILREVEVAPVEALSPPVTGGEPPRGLEAVPIVHVRVNYVALHAAREAAPEIAARASRHPKVELAVARLPDPGPGLTRFGIWRDGEGHFFERDAAGSIAVEDPDRWRWLEVDLTPWSTSAEGPEGSDGLRGAAHLADREAFEATRRGRYPDLFYRVATAFTHPAARFPAEVLLSLPDDVASYGFTVPGAGDVRAVDGFHGGLSREATLSVVAAEGQALPEALRSDDLADLFPVLGGGP